MTRAINGWDEVITCFDDYSDERIRHRIDNRLAMSLTRARSKMRSQQVLESIVMLALTRPVSTLCLGMAQKISG